MSTYRIEQLEMCDRQMFGDLILTCPTPAAATMSQRIIQPIPYTVGLRRSSDETPLKTSIENEKRRASAMLDELLVDIYNHIQNTTTDYNSATSGRSHKSVWLDVTDLHEKDVVELISIINCLKAHVERMGSILVRQLKRRDALRRQQDTHCDVITRQLSKRTADGSDMRFTIQPVPGESGFSQWAAAMKMVAQLPGGIPPEFRSRLWLTLADRHLASQKVDWPKVEKSCFSEWAHATDAELGIQIVKDLHRTGCSLFCGEDGVENQALLKKVLLAYARWNKAVGYCQGFNMLAALILQVTDKNESDALKLMIYLIEGVLPDSYFADSLRGLSVDMAVFRELLKTRLPRLSKHLDTLQNAAKDGTTSYEPPLTNVFTMQWFLTLFCNCLPQPTVLRVWDLILLEGNEILLRTALAIWQTLAERILSVRSADEFYCIMGVLTRELLEFGLVDANSLIKAVVRIGPLTELKSLREHYLYNINPWGPSLCQAIVHKQLKLYPRERLALDISALKKQYVKLKQRQRQAHIIFSAAISRQPAPSAPVAMNHLLLGKSALVTAKRLGPPKGSIPPARQPPSTLHWKDTKPSSSSSSSDTELCDEDTDSSTEDEEQTNICQFDDNLTAESDTNLMKNDNTTSAKVSASEINLLDFHNSPRQTLVVSPSKSTILVSPTSLIPIQELSDNFIDTRSATPEKTMIPPDSDEENFDFEQFLVDRLKTPTEVEPPDKEVARINFARRNSERALQIIQENSLILHRILQCQSRLSPSPPPEIQASDITTMSSSDTALILCSSLDVGDSLKCQLQEQEMVSEKYLETSSWIDSLSEDSSVNTKPSVSIREIQSKFDLKLESCDSDDIKSPEYGSKYTSILEKSKSLDERYNSLILNANRPSASIKIDEYRVSASKSEEKFSAQMPPHYAADEQHTKVLSPLQPYIFVDETSPSFPSSLPPLLKCPGVLGETTSGNSDEIISEKVESVDITLQSIESGSFSPTNYSHSLIDLDDGKASAESCTPSDEKMRDYRPELSANTESLDYKSFLSELSDSTTCYNYLRSPVKETNSWANSPDKLPDSTISLSTNPKENTDKSNLFNSPSSHEHSPEHELRPDDFKYARQKKSPTLELDEKSYGESSNLKSPNKIFNPFPVPLSSRQSKEVPLKLGLYKK